MKKNKLKRVFSIALAAVMVAGTVTVTPLGASKVQAKDNEAPTSGYWTDADGLKTFGISGDKTIGKIKFGASNRLWAICGVDGENLALLSTSEFEQAAYGSNSKYSESNFVNNIDRYLSETYFSAGETNKMAEVTVTTNEQMGVAEIS